jgi:hypothetical protein
VHPARRLHLLAARHGERPRVPPPYGVRHDHLVDGAALGADEGREEAILALPGPRRDPDGSPMSARKMISTRLAPRLGDGAAGQAQSTPLLRRRKCGTFLPLREKRLRVDMGIPQPLRL